MKKAIGLVVMLGVAMLATGCSSEEDDAATIACGFYTNGAIAVCVTGDLSADKCTADEGVVIDSCPSGVLLSCPDAVANGTVNMYLKTSVDALKSLNASDPCAEVVN